RVRSVHTRRLSAVNHPYQLRINLCRNIHVARRGRLGQSLLGEEIIGRSYRRIQSLIKTNAAQVGLGEGMIRTSRSRSALECMRCCAALDFAEAEVGEVHDGGAGNPRLSLE